MTLSDSAQFNQQWVQQIMLPWCENSTSDLIACCGTGIAQTFSPTKVRLWSCSVCCMSGSRYTGWLLSGYLLHLLMDASVIERAPSYKLNSEGQSCCSASHMRVSGMMAATNHPQRLIVCMRHRPPEQKFHSAMGATGTLAHLSLTFPPGFWGARTQQSHREFAQRLSTRVVNELANVDSTAISSQWVAQGYYL